MSLMPKLIINFPIFPKRAWYANRISNKLFIYLFLILCVAKEEFLRLNKLLKVRERERHLKGCRSPQMSI